MPLYRLNVAFFLSKNFTSDISTRRYYEDELSTADRDCGQNGAATEPCQGE
jgi:hypothetical protein